MGLIDFIKRKNAKIDNYFNSAIIVSAGSGKRVGLDIPKQNYIVRNIPIIVRAVSAFESCSFINEIIVVSRTDDVAYYNDLFKSYGIKKVTKIVPGRETRFQSVIEGFKCISDNSDFVFIHDAARCLITQDEIKKVGSNACINGAAFAAVRPTDTVKLDKDKKIETIDRNNIWLAQTPQVFKTSLYRAAAFKALNDSFQPTDDTSVVEYAGFSTFPVECSRDNFKVTFGNDLYIAEEIIKRRESNE